MGSTSEGTAPVVTLAALYGAGGTVVGPRVAERLGVRFFDREAMEREIDQIGRTGDVTADDEVPSALDRLTSGLGRLSTLTGGAGGSFERFDADIGHRRGDLEEKLAATTREGGVALGRGGMVVLRPVPWALHVHLGGPEESRIDQAMALFDLDRAEADARCRTEDRSRRAYVRRHYGIDGSDPAWFHLMLDSTAVDLDTCVELITTAALARVRDPRPCPPL